MNAWIRPPATDAADPEPWHYQTAMSYSGLRTAKCGYSVPPSELVEQRPYDDVPTDAVCIGCAPTD